MKRWCFATCLKFFIGFIFCALTLGVAVMLLWNWLIPFIFKGGPEITYIQALGILVLCRILFGFKGGWKSCGGGCSSDGYKGYWKKRWEEKIATLSPEEKEKMKEKYKKCCGSSHIED